MTNYVDDVMFELQVECHDLDYDLAQLYTLLVLVAGEQTTLKDVHDAWAVWRNATNPDHKSLVPFEQLSSEVQELDRPYMDAIHAAARAIPTSPGEETSR